MNTPSMSSGYWERKGLMQLGAVEVPSIQNLEWDVIPRDFLPVFLYRTAAPKALIAANRFQLDELKKIDKDVHRECYILEIKKIRTHSNLDYCADDIEMDRKYPRRKKKLLTNTTKQLLTDIVENLNRSKTASELAAFYKTSVSNVNLLAVKLRKEYNFKIPGARGFSEFDAMAKQLVKDHPEMIMQPLAKKDSAFVMEMGRKKAITATNGR